MRLAEHLAVGDVGCAAATPCRYVVGVHFVETPYFAFVGVITERTERAV
jgi:hypothetical protein